MKVDIGPMADCPRFYHCSAPICPLDPDMDIRVPAVADEPECTLPKSKRMELGADLPWRGLWPKELGGLRAWENMADESRARFVLERKKHQFTTAKQD